jgi:hypothetical protein
MPGVLSLKNVSDDKETVEETVERMVLALLGVAREMKELLQKNSVLHEDYNRFFKEMRPTITEMVKKIAQKPLATNKGNVKIEEIEEIDGGKRKSYKLKRSKLKRTKLKRTKKKKKYQSKRRIKQKGGDIGVYSFYFMVLYVLYLAVQRGADRQGRGIGWIIT